MTINVYCQRWTKGSTECYENNLMCSSNCSNYKYCQKYKNMKKSTILLYTKFGKPPKYLLEKNYDY